jgi:small subunit ribosomal protein S1
MDDAPVGLTWDEVKERFPVGAAVEGTITTVVPYGVWVDLGMRFQGLVLAPDAGMQKGEQTSDCFQQGQVISANVLWWNDEQQVIRLTRRA